VASPDVVIVGAGAIGLSSALELARAGATVTVVEQAAELPAGCSAGNAGLVCPSHSSPLASRSSLRLGLRSAVSRDGPFTLAPRPSLVPWLARFVAATTPAREKAATDAIRALALASVELHLAYREQMATGLEPTGTLNVFDSETGLASGLREAAENAAAGLRSEALTPREASELEPALAPGFAGAVFYPGDLSGDPAAFVRAVAAAARELGVELRLGTEAFSLGSRQSRVTGIETTAGRIAADAVVLAAGAWTPRLARTVGVEVPVEAGKGYHLDFEGAETDPRLPVFVRESHLVVTPMAGRLRLTGVLALSGLDQSIDQRRLDAIEATGSRRIPAFAGRRRVEVWRGLRPCSPDGVPIIGRPDGHENLVVATGHGTLGFTLAPVTGRLVAQLVTGQEPEHDLGALRPSRFRALRP
jgi:D-amino-acid dehydrogenase